MSQNCINNTSSSLTITSFGRGMVRSSSAGTLSSINGTNGQVLIASTGADPAWASLTAGTNITLTPGANSLTIAAASSGITWTEVTGSGGGADINIANGTGYIMNNTPSVQRLLLPATCPVGFIFEVVNGENNIANEIRQNSGQTITWNDTTGIRVSTTTGIIGYIAVGGNNALGAQLCGVRLICVTANTVFTIISYTGFPATV